MDLMNNVTDQKAYLEENLNKIEIVLSEFIGLNVNLTLEEKVIRNQTYFKLKCAPDLRYECGILKRCFREIKLNSRGIWFFKEGSTIQFEYHFELLDFGNNGIDICQISVENGTVYICD